jgi:hypothetical protein
VREGIAHAGPLRFADVLCKSPAPTREAGIDPANAPRREHSPGTRASRGPAIEESEVHGGKEIHGFPQVRLARRRLPIALPQRIEDCVELCELFHIEELAEIAEEHRLERTGAHQLGGRRFTIAAGAPASTPPAGSGAAPGKATKSQAISNGEKSPRARARIPPRPRHLGVSRN